jgi:hypothetical protein
MFANQNFQIVLVSMLGQSNIGGLNVTITCKVVVYTPAERTDTVYCTLHLFLFYPFLLCGLNRPVALL